VCRGTRAGVTLTVNGLSTDQVSYYLDGSYDPITASSSGGNKIPNPRVRRFSFEESQPIQTV